MSRIFYKITMADKKVWFASGMDLGGPEKSLAVVQKAAEKKGVGATYELATQKEYQAHRSWAQGMKVLQELKART